MIGEDAAILTPSANGRVKTAALLAWLAGSPKFFLRSRRKIEDGDEAPVHALTDPQN